MMEITETRVNQFIEMSTFCLKFNDHQLCSTYCYFHSGFEIIRHKDYDDLKSLAK